MRDPFFWFLLLSQWNLLLLFMQLFVTSCTAAHKVSLSFPVSRNLLNSSPLSRWCHPTISSSVILFSFCAQSFSASGSFPVSQLFTLGGQSIGVPSSVLPMNIQGWFPLGLTDLISLLSKGLSRVFSSTTVWKHQFFSTQPSLQSNSYICTWLLEKSRLWLYVLFLAKWYLCFLTLCWDLS